MIDPVAILVEFLSTSAPTLASALQAASPPAGWDVRDHIHGGSDLPTGWRVDQQGPVVMVDLRGGQFPLEDMPLIDASMQLQVFAYEDELARSISNAMADDLNDRGWGGFTFARLNTPIQVIPDRSTEWRIGINYYTVRVRNI